MIDLRILSRLNVPDKHRRLDALRDIHANTAYPPANPRYVNNHIHTSYSFSPYSPAAAVYAARAEGLCTAGIVDHDSIAGANEFLQAAEIIDMPATLGAEFRVSLADTPLAQLRTNNPDQSGIAYMTLQGVPRSSITAVQGWFTPFRAARNMRNENMVRNINALLRDESIALDFKLDVLPLSMWNDGGSVTERHLMYALAGALIKKVGMGSGLISLLERLDIPLNSTQTQQLLDTHYPFYAYEVLGILKGVFVPRIYVDAHDECPSLSQAVSFAKDVGAILCYPYLGDVTQNITGDKRAQRFEDAYLDELLKVMFNAGVHAVTYMPARNTRQQLLRVRSLCEKLNMFQVSGEDVNSPRQSFICSAMDDPLFDNLIKNTWTLIAR
ncbi:MAG: PHP domain-containing protein [Clostridia bacterium]